MKIKHKSKQRDAILEKLRSTKSHPTAEWIYYELKPQHPGLSLATVYRNLKLFREEGEIIAVGTVAGQERFDANTSEHTHFVCDTCRAVIDIDYQSNHSDLTKILQEQGFIVDFAALSVRGKCKNCVSTA